jgi:hypothetical protein
LELVRRLQFPNTSTAFLTKTHHGSFEDYDNASSENRFKCPLCRGNTLNEDGLLIVDIVNEGGFTGGFDLGRELDEERWRDAQPETWKKEQALLELCQEGEFEEAEKLMRDDHVDPNAAYPGGTTGLHMAAYDDDIEWASLCASFFLILVLYTLTPDAVLKYSANKELKNEEGDTALDCAREAKSQGVVDLLTGS